MRIESGFARFNEGETINVTFHGVDYTQKNHRPFARCEDDEGTHFNVNIKDSDKRLRPGRYRIKCTGVSSTGLSYVEFRHLQHSSWDKRDELTEATTVEPVELVEPVDDEVDVYLELVTNAIKLLGKARATLHDLDNEYLDKDSTLNHIDKARKELYYVYGREVYHDIS